MSISDPKHLDPANPGRARNNNDSHLVPSGGSPWGIIRSVGESRNLINQIRSTAPAGAKGWGIPLHVFNVSVNASPAAKGTTSAVSVNFQRNAADPHFGGVKLFARGYQGNPSLTEIGSGTESPITAVLQNTGEPISIVAQAFGNNGQAPIATAPSTGMKLPQSISGGYGTGTNAPGVNKLIGDVTGNATGTTISTTLSAIDGTPVVAGSPTAGTYLFYNGTNWIPYNPFLAAPSWHDSGEGGPYAWNPNGGAIGKNTGQVFFFMFKLAYTFTFKRCSFRAVTGGAGSLSAFGIYSPDGTTKLISWDAIATTSTTNYSVTAGPVTLQPGLYLFAYACSGGTQAPNTDSGYSTSGTSDTSEAWNLDGTYIRSGAGANALSAGAMPSSLGALSTAGVPATIMHVTFTPV
jgi:hypothetical protein